MRSHGGAWALTLFGDTGVGSTVSCIRVRFSMSLYAISIQSIMQRGRSDQNRLRQLRYASKPWDAD
ncbi:hypothetical protein PM082_016527 [Marasmius tenuissimus]|nr:hypothetical protein PM082_016527 [Marasmius tenuissimus]